MFFYILEQYPNGLTFKLICEALDKKEDVQLVLIGPKDCDIPSHKQIHYIGSVERQYIYSLMEQAFCFGYAFYRK